MEGGGEYTRSSDNTGFGRIGGRLDDRKVEARRTGIGEGRGG